MKSFQFKYRIDPDRCYTNITDIDVCEIAQIPAVNFEDCEWTDYHKTYYSIITAPNKNAAIHIFKIKLKNKLKTDINIYHEKRWDE